MNLTLTRRGGIGLAATVVAAALVIAPALSASAAVVPTVGSAHPLYLTSGEDGSQIPAGSVLGWNSDVFATPDGPDPDYNSSFAVPAAAGSVVTFLSPRGQETTKSAWNATGPLGLTPSGIMLPNLKPSSLTTPGTGSPSTAAGVANAGGDYSLGIAFIANNGNQVLEANFTYITVVGNSNPALATWTFDTPAAAEVAPAITTQPAAASVLPGQPATFTAAASGTSPTVQWQSAPAGSSTFADIAGATSASYTTAAATLADTGTQFRAVFTNSAGSATTNAATLTVVNTVPTEPTGSDAGKVTIADPAQGATTVTVAAGASRANQTLQAWGWSTPTNLGQVTTDGSGNATVPVGALAAGASHTIALTLPNSASVIVWGTIAIPAPAYPDQTATLPITANVKASDLWSLNAQNTAIDFNDVSRGQSATRALGKVTVVDDRNVLKGWTLNAAWADFTHGTDTIPSSAMTVTPKIYTGSSLLPGITLGATAGLLAQSTAGVSTGVSGALFDGDLTFTAPQNAPVGTYNSTLTLTLASK